MSNHPPFQNSKACVSYFSPRCNKTPQKINLTDKGRDFFLTHSLRIQPDMVEPAWQQDLVTTVTFSLQKGRKEHWKKPTSSF